MPNSTMKPLASKKTNQSDKAMCTDASWDQKWSRAMSTAQGSWLQTQKTPCRERATVKPRDSRQRAAPPGAKGPLPNPTSRAFSGQEVGALQGSLSGELIRSFQDGPKYPLPFPNQRPPCGALQSSSLSQATLRLPWPESLLIPMQFQDNWCTLIFESQKTQRIFSNATIQGSPPRKFIYCQWAPGKSFLSHRLASL